MGNWLNYYLFIFLAGVWCTQCVCSHMFWFHLFYCDTVPWQKTNLVKKGLFQLRVLRYSPLLWGVICSPVVFGSIATLV